MEKFNINLSDLSPLMCSLIEKIQLLDSHFLTKQQKLNYFKEMSEVVDNMRSFFKKSTDSMNETDQKVFVERFERVFSQFEWNSNVAVSPFEFNKLSENGKILISSILKLLGIKGCGILIIETYMKLCLKILSDMAVNVDNNLSTEKSNFKLLLEGFFATASAIKKYWHISLSNDQKNNIMLCLLQICKVLPNLLKLLDVQCTNVKIYLLDLLKKCLDRIQKEIHCDENKETSTHGQEFILIMDFCLYKLNELSVYSNEFPSFIERSNETVALLKPAIDELLCCVMSVAQVTSFKEDHSSILMGCQKVLKELVELQSKIKDENGSAIKLNASSLGESLCRLEQKVNTAVLKLVLEVFSSVNSPLKNILNKCREDIAKSSKASEDLNLLISDFDSEMDKIMQIGLFAISCTTSIGRILKIESCLASLESLETELIPSLTTLYVDCSAKNRATFQFLFDFWLKEITELKVLIDSILDAPGFCEIVKNQVKNLGLPLKEDVSSKICLNKLKYNLKQATRFSKKLLRTLKTSMEDDNENFNRTTDDHLKNFNLGRTSGTDDVHQSTSTSTDVVVEQQQKRDAASIITIQECEAVLDKMNEGQDSLKTTKQAIKRYDFLMHTLEKLSSHLFLLVSKEETECDEKENISEVASLQKIQIPHKSYYKLCEISDVTDTATGSIPEILTPYLNKGILRSKQRNVLYSTSSKTDKYENNFNKTILQTRHWDKTPISSKRSRCCKPLSLTLELENTIDLEITTILENISELSNSFFKTLQSNSGVQAQSEYENKDQVNCKHVSCGSEKEPDPIKLTYTSSGCCAKLDSKENIESVAQEHEDEKTFLGFKLRNSFLQKLKDLSQKESLSVEKVSETSSCFDSRERINDLKIVEEKINFLKARMPFGPL